MSALSAHCQQLGAGNVDCAHEKMRREQGNVRRELEVLAVKTRFLPLRPVTIDRWTGTSVVKTQISVMIAEI